MKKAKHIRQAGFALIEVLASVLIMAFCLLSIAGLLVFTQKSNSSSYIKQQAIQSAYDMIDLMRSNRATSTLVGATNTYVSSNLGTCSTAPVAPTPSCTAGTCTSTQLAAWDVFEWQTRLFQFGGCGSIAAAAPTPPIPVTALAETSSAVTVTVQWNDAPAFGTAAKQTLGGS
ncbi:MAG TPA: type IV pilus modification protein PilV, partial [Burkholderiaceae bacterium]|nr:type IV pilus modification protein PilV [Burkholderiaceae bacterium]